MEKVTGRDPKCVDCVNIRGGITTVKEQDETVFIQLFPTIHHATHALLSMYHFNTPESGSEMSPFSCGASGGRYANLPASVAAAVSARRSRSQLG